MRATVLQPVAVKGSKVAGIVAYQDSVLAGREGQLRFVIAGIHCDIERRCDVEGMASQCCRQSMLSAIFVKVELHGRSGNPEERTPSS